MNKPTTATQVAKNNKDFLELLAKLGSKLDFLTSPPLSVRLIKAMTDEEHGEVLQYFVAAADPIVEGNAVSWHTCPKGIFDAFVQLRQHLGAPEFEAEYQRRLAVPAAVVADEPKPEVVTTEDNNVFGG